MRDANDVLREAVKCHETGDFARAEYLYCKLIAHDEKQALLPFMLGTLYAQCLAHGRAITFLKKAIELEPSGNGAMENLASVYRQMEDREQARYWGEKALALQRTPIALSNMAGSYINWGEPEKALYWADEALKLAPKMPEARNHRALALLEMGRYEEGFAEYDARMDLAPPAFTRRPFTCPLWDGKPVGKLAIHGEQGLGDEIMFGTLIPRLLPLVQECHVECAARLVGLFRHSFRDEPKVRIYGTYDELAAGVDADAWVAFGSLPHLMWPWTKCEYLQSSREYPKGARPRVGISWFGGSELTHMRLRNAPLSCWVPFVNRATAVGAEVISLQYGDRADEAAQLDIEHDAETIADMDGLTAMVRSCDLVVSVCNTTVHQAGATGTPCWQLVPNRPDWRCGLSDERYRWYDSVEFIRQGAGESWGAVLARATRKIETWASAQSAAELIE